MAFISVNGLYKIFGTHPQRVFPLLEQGLSKSDILEKTGCTVGINDATFDVNRSETFVIMGLSGSGKSTVIRCLNRLIPPTRGTVMVGDKDILKMSREELLTIRRSTMSMVFQHFGLLPHRTVLANTEYGLEVAGMAREERRERARQAIEVVGLKGYEDSLPGECSGGMQQRVGLARALASDPEVLLMDEAFSALDPLIRTQMQDELLQLQARLHKTIVFITHDLDEALKLGDRIAIMNAGAIVQIGTPEEILTRPANDYVRKFVENVDRTKVLTAGGIMHKAETITYPKDGPRVATRAMEKSGQSIIFVTDADRHLMGFLSIDDAVELERRQERDIKPKVSDDLYVTDPDTPVASLLSRAVSARYPLAVVDDEARLKGIVDRATIIGQVLGKPPEDEAPTALADVLNDAAPDTPGSERPEPEEENGHDS